ncbi:hypothetical protein [Neorhodopirellula pilleata]|uniref:Uncharacterized protein n=1 Tax=Neorhodopirellula pilleata TaxID=2714738 RepID=A0A5C6AN22_9BACT|nr:hypothetical protein [Neorhodopirellula pilleata]TWU01453.1 hypothetical protein Pla100_11870 [Neorhodopirellula pilleata]
MRWTVSLHRVGEGFRRDSEDHLDWFFEHNSEQNDDETSGALITFASDLSPTVRPSKSGIIIVPVDRLPDHRHIYLDYQGELSGNRGQITPILSGQFRWGSSGTEDKSSVAIELVTIEIRDHSLAAMVRLADSWRAMLCSAPCVPLRLGPL